MLGATSLVKKEGEKAPPGAPHPGPGRPTGSRTLASAPDGARTLLGGVQVAGTAPGRKDESSPPGVGSSAPPPVPGMESEDEYGRTSVPAGGSGPYVPRTLESLRAVTADSLVGKGLYPHPNEPARAPGTGIPGIGGSFNKTLTGASYLPRRALRLGDNPPQGGSPPQKSSFPPASAAPSERTLTGLMPEQDGAPPTPMRPTGATVVGFPMEGDFAGAAPPSSDALALAISMAAAGQLRESELPVPSERLDVGILRQLGQLDEALKSSPRVPSFARPISAPPGSEDEEARIPSSALNAPSPGSVPAPSALPEALSPQENSSGLPTVGRYEVLARLKSGGMGSVYMCRLSGKAGFRRLFAMKVLHAHLAQDREALESFEQEARVLALLHHPNVVGVVDVGSTREPYIVLEYIEGGSLHELFRATEHGRDPRFVVTLVLEALEGLRATHLAADEDGNWLGLVHCDVCPQNILVGVDGSARLTDFGIAQTSESLKRGGTLRGKPRYIAPERLDGTNVDARADLFSLGGVLYAGLTGIDAFVGETTQETRWNVGHKEPVAPSEVGFRPPPSLDWVVLKALAKDPASRFQSAEEFERQLRRVAEREDLIASRVELGEWIRDVLAPTLRARRVAAQRGTGAIARDVAPREAMRPLPRGAGDVEEPAAGEHTSPVSSGARSVEHTEILPEGAAGEAGYGSRRGLYIALALVVGVVGWAMFSPDSMSRLFLLTEPPEGAPIEVVPEEDVVVPEISAPFGDVSDEQAPTGDETAPADGDEP